MAGDSLHASRLTELPIHTGPGTPGGDLLRRYWQPIGMSAEIVLGGAPQHVKILGEDLVLFRDEHGKVGLLDLHCAHRLADLSYGRIEDGGIRCVYHGWVFDVNGKCLEQPAEPHRGGTGRERVRMKAYPCHESAGAIWAYMGPGKPPLFPNYPAISAPEAYVFAHRWHSNCNYLQGNEGNIDPIHTSYLHSFKADSNDRGDVMRTGVTQDIFSVDTAPRLTVQDARWGLRLLTDRKMPGGDKRMLRVTNFIMPNGCAIGGAETPFGMGGMSIFYHVPIDDESHWRVEFTFHSKVKLPKDTMDKRYEDEFEADGRPKRRPENRYLQDRAAMKTSYLGMGRNFPVHDLFVTESQGVIADRAQENLVSSDLAIVRQRRMLIEAMEEIRAGKDPVGVQRETEKNEYSDLLVLSEVIDANSDLDQYCAQMEQRAIYQLDPTVVAK